MESNIISLSQNPCNRVPASTHLRVQNKTLTASENWLKGSEGEQIKLKHVFLGLYSSKKKKKKVPTPHKAASLYAHTYTIRNSLGNSNDVSIHFTGSQRQISLTKRAPVVFLCLRGCPTVKLLSRYWED